MRIILKPNDRDRCMIEIWDENYDMLFAVTHIDLFYAMHTKTGEDLWNALNSGKSAVVSLQIDKLKVTKKATKPKGTIKDVN